MIIAAGATSQSLDVQIVDDAALAVTGLVAATFPAVSWTRSGNTAATSISLSDLAAITTAYASGGVKERSGGYYRLDLPDAAIATAGTVKLIGEAAGKHLIAEPIVVGGANSVPTVGTGAGQISLSGGAVTLTAAYDAAKTAAPNETDPSAVAAAVRAIGSDRVDFIMLGDSEILVGGNGVDEGLAYTLSFAGPQFASPMYTWRPNNGSGAGQGYLMAAGTSQGASSGAPAELAAYLDKGTGAPFPDDYLFGDIGATDIGGITFTPGNPLDVSAALLWEFHVGTFPSGTHNMWPAITMEGPFAYDPFDTHGPLSYTTGAYGITRTDFNVPANPDRAGRQVEFRPIVFGGAGATGMFGLYQRVSRPDRPNGWSVTTLDGRGGQPARVVATDLQQLSDLTLGYKFGQMRRLQGAFKRFVFVIYGGQDEEADATLSVGPNPQAGNTAGGAKDNRTAIANRLRYVWNLNGWPQSELNFWLITTHPMDAPGVGREVWLETLRAASEDWCRTQPQSRHTDLSLYTSYADLTARGMYLAPPDPAHLTAAGYYYVMGLALADVITDPQPAPVSWSSAGNSFSSTDR